MPAGRPRGVSRYRDLSPKGGHKRDCFTKALNAASAHVGGDVEGWIMDVLARMKKDNADGTTMTRLHHELLDCQPFRSIMHSLNELLKNTTDYNKRQIGSIFVAAGFTRNSLRQFGINIGERCAFRFFHRDMLGDTDLLLCSMEKLTKTQVRARRRCSSPKTRPPQSSRAD